MSHFINLQNNMDCLFCKIVAQQIPNYTVYEDEHALAFLDIHPCVAGHTVVIPKVHALTLPELPAAEVGPLFLGVQATMQRLQEVLRPDGFTVGWNHGEAGGQAVPHVHIHVLPRYDNDGGGNMHSVVRNPSERPVDAVAKLFE